MAEEKIMGSTSQTASASGDDGAPTPHLSSGGPMPVVAALRSIRHHLDNLKHRTTGRDPKLNGYAYAEVPDWALRQWVDALEYINRPHPEWCGAESEDEPCPDCGATAEFGVCQSINNRPRPRPLVEFTTVRKDAPAEESRGRGPGVTNDGEAT